MAGALGRGVAGTGVATSGDAREECRQDRRGHEHAMATAAEETEATSTKAEEPQSAAAKEA